MVCQGPSTGGVAPSSGVRTPVMGYSSSGLLPAKAAVHPQVTKLVTTLPSKLSPAYTPTAKQTPGNSSAKRSSFAGSGDAASRFLGTPDGPGSDGGAAHDEDANEKPKEDLEVAKRRRAQESIMRKVCACADLHRPGLSGGRRLFMYPECRYLWNPLLPCCIACWCQSGTVQGGLLSARRGRA